MLHEKVLMVIIERLITIKWVLMAIITRLMINIRRLMAIIRVLIEIMAILMVNIAD
jgi:hypothetical protein